jgi:hypothetical protein
MINNNPVVIGRRDLKQVCSRPRLKGELYFKDRILRSLLHEELRYCICYHYNLPTRTKDEAALLLGDRTSIRRTGGDCRSAMKS